MEVFLDKQVRASSPLMQHAYANFDSNLRDTISVALKSGARVIVSTVSTNLKDCAPFASLHREDLKPDDLRLWTSLVQQGADLEASRTYDEALKSYLAAEKVDGEYAELEFRIGRALWQTGNYPAAREHFARARDLDTLRFRADSKINDINRAVASSAAGAELIDADAIFASASPNGITGSDLVYEHVHLTPEGNYLLARAMYLQIASKLPGQSGQPVKDGDVPSQAECERLLALTGHDRLRMTNEMLERLQKAPFTNQVNHVDQAMRLMIEASAPDENPDQTVAEYQWAVRQEPDDRILHYNFGLFLFDHDRNAAGDQLRMARPWDGFPVFAPDGTPLD
jgi:tetratricopeptide (TPR) repeat protein